MTNIEYLGLLKLVMLMPRPAIDWLDGERSRTSARLKSELRDLEARIDRARRSWSASGFPAIFRGYPEMASAGAYLWPKTSIDYVGMDFFEPLRNFPPLSSSPFPIRLVAYPELDVGLMMERLGAGMGAGDIDACLILAELFREAGLDHLAEPIELTCDPIIARRVATLHDIILHPGDHDPPPDFDPPFAGLALTIPAVSRSYPEASRDQELRSTIEIGFRRRLRPRARRTA